MHERARPPQKGAARAGPTGASRVATNDLVQVRALFAQLAANHVRQVRDFLIDLRGSGASVEWVNICAPALRSLRGAAEKLELYELCEALDRFSDALVAALASDSRMIEGERRQAILARYQQLSMVMPQVFAIDLERAQRETIILHSLLSQVPEVTKVAIDKLYAAGLTTLEVMLLANPGDITASSGIPEVLAARIVARFQEYREQLRSNNPDATSATERGRVAQLTARLRREHDEYQLVSQQWTSEAAEKKKDLRKQRAQTLLDIQVVLGRLGEIERLQEIERLPFEKKLARLEAFLEEAREYKHEGQR